MGSTRQGTQDDERTTKRIHKPETVSMTVIEAIAELESVPPMELDIPVYTAVDLEALDTLCAEATGEFRLSFQVAAYDVSIRGGDTVSVERQAGSTPVSARAGTQ